MRRRLAFLILVAICVMFARGCPPICPECEVFTNIFLTEYHPELGTVTKLCVQGRCDLLPWCFEVFVIQIKWFPPFLPLIPYDYESYLWDSLFVKEEDVEFLTSKDVSASVRNGLATVCVSRGYEIGIPIADVIIKIPVAGLRGKACMGKCPCEAWGWIPPVVTVDLHPTDNPRRPVVIVSASDPDGDIVCFGYEAAKGTLSSPYGPGPFITALGFFERCEEELIYEPPSKCDDVTDVVTVWAKDGRFWV